jgi:hypothetical protein
VVKRDMDSADLAKIARTAVKIERDICGRRLGMY